MLLLLEKLLTPDEVESLRRELASAPFVDGRASARGIAKNVKKNLQLPPEDPIALVWAERLKKRLDGSDAFQNAAFPRRFLPLRFCKYEPGMSYGAHFDLPMMRAPDGRTLRTDISMTLFLSRREDYDGGALVFDSDYGERTIVGEAGDAVIYPSTTMHRVEPVTRGERLVAITWIESMVRDPADRKLLHELMHTVLRIEKKTGPTDETTALRGLHYQLLRRWLET